MKMSPYTGSYDNSVMNHAVKPIAEPPDLPWGHLFEPGAGREGGGQKSLT